MIWDHRFTAFTFGLIGGTGVNLYRIFTVVHRPTVERIEFNGLYWFQFVAIAAMGGFVALAHDLSQPITPWVAMNVGLAVPALLKAGAEEQQKRRTKTRKSN